MAMKRGCHILLLFSCISPALYGSASCTPMAPPSFSTVRSLELTEKNSVNLTVTGGGGNHGGILHNDVHGWGGGIDVEYRPVPMAGIALDLIGGKGLAERNENDFPCIMNCSEDDDAPAVKASPIIESGALTQFGLGLPVYLGRIEGWSYLMAFEPRVDFTIMTNGSFTVTPSGAVTVGFVARYVELSGTSKLGWSDPVIQGSPVETGCGPSPLVRTTFIEADIVLLFHAGPFAFGPFFRGFQALGPWPPLDDETCEEESPEGRGWVGGGVILRFSLKPSMINGKS